MWAHTPCDSRYMNGVSRRMSRACSPRVVSLRLLGGVPPLSLNIEGEEDGCWYYSGDDVPRRLRR